MLMTVVGDDESYTHMLQLWHYFNLTKRNS